MIPLYVRCSTIFFFYFTLGCCVTSWPWSLEPPAVHEVHCPAESNRKQKLEGDRWWRISKNWWKPSLFLVFERFDVHFNRNFKRNSRYIYSKGWRMYDSNPAIFRFSSSTRWNDNNKSGKCWFLNEITRNSFRFKLHFYAITRTNRSRFFDMQICLSYPSRWKDRYACYSTPLSCL